MTRPIITLISMLAFVPLHTGCIHHQLRRSARTHASSVAEIHTQQVLDNLAKFAHTSEAVPYFSLASATSNEVNDSIDASGPSLSLRSFTLASWGLDAGASRGNKQSLTLTPTTDPRKLELMRCAYQNVVDGSCGCIQSGCCPDCSKRFRRFYVGTERLKKTPRMDANGNLLFAMVPTSRSSTYDIDSAPVVAAKRNQLNDVFYEIVNSNQIVTSKYLEKSKSELKALFDDNSVATHTQQTGKVTVDCLSSGWYKKGSKKDFKNADPCCLIGEYCGTYVLVPSCYRGELAKLTLVMLDIATHKPAEEDKDPETSERDVMLKILAQGDPDTDYKNQEMRAAETKGGLPTPEALEALEKLAKPPTQSLSPVPGANLLFQDQYIRTLTPNQ